MSTSLSLGVVDIDVIEAALEKLGIQLSASEVLEAIKEEVVKKEQARKFRRPDYALMLAPPAPGKRPEKLRFNLSLLFSEGVEYSIQEARARSKGLFGKKWGPPPESESSRFSSTSSSTSSALVQFNDDGKRSSRLKPIGRKSLMGGAEPTVTINTKEALDDVFGMYNSPEKTHKLMIPGSKHAPLKNIDPVTPIVPPRINFLKENENVPNLNAKTPKSSMYLFFSVFFGMTILHICLAFPALTPFKDENARTPFKVFSRPPEQNERVVPLGGRFGQFNVMTPITERTVEFTGCTARGTPTKFHPSNPCNPFDSAILSTLISRVPTDLQFYDLRGQRSNKLNELERFVKKIRKTSGGSDKTGVLDCSAFTLVLRGHKFNVTEKLGEGGFGSVFKARDAGIQMEEDDDDEDFDDGDEESSSMVALKVVKPRNIWEYHVLRRLYSSLPPSMRRSVVLPHALYAFDDESYLVLELCPQGMLLNIINNAVSAGVSQAGACLDELLVMFFSIELLRLVEAMHNAGFIHGDLKIDNCLLRLEEVPGGATGWSSSYQPSGEGGWSYKGLKVIDFGRTIDTKQFPRDQQFIADWPTDERDCFEVRENRPWTYQTDYFGLAGIIYCMLFGKYIQANSVLAFMHEESGIQKYKIATPFKRYWQTDIWNRLFDVLLNPCLVRSTGELPVCDALGELRKEMELWLHANCNRTSNTLKGLLKKVEMSCY